MLVLNRRSEESILIDGGISICVLNITRNTVTIGICAPKETKILRAELTAFRKATPHRRRSRNARAPER